MDQAIERRRWCLCAPLCTVQKFAMLRKVGRWHLRSRHMPITNTPLHNNCSAPLVNGRRDREASSGRDGRQVVHAWDLWHGKVGRQPLLRGRERSISTLVSRHVLDSGRNCPRDPHPERSGTKIEGLGQFAIAYLMGTLPPAKVDFLLPKQRVRSELLFGASPQRPVPSNLFHLLQNP